MGSAQSNKLGKGHDMGYASGAATRYGVAPGQGDKSVLTPRTSARLNVAGTSDVASYRKYSRNSSGKYSNQMNYSNPYPSNLPYHAEMGNPSNTGSYPIHYKDRSYIRSSQPQDFSLAGVRGPSTEAIKRKIRPGNVFSDEKTNSITQIYEDFNKQLSNLMELHPLVIQTYVLPAGVTPDDPRLANAKIVSENHYVTEKPTIPMPSFLATFHPSLVPENEPTNRIVVSR